MTLGAYWLDPNVVEYNLSDIKFAITTFQKDVLSERQVANLQNRERFEYFDQCETDLMHIGHMISNYSDRNVVNMHDRIIEIQELGNTYDQSLTDPMKYQKRVSLWKELQDKSLSLGTEVRYNLRESISQVRNFGQKLNISLNEDSNFND